jgi:hypothetical protein
MTSLTLFPKVWKSGKKPTRPHVNKNHFQEALGFLTFKLNKVSKNNII